MDSGAPLAVRVETGATFWRELVRTAIPEVATPFYLLSVIPLRAALAELEILDRSVPVPVRHWLSCKTQPVRPLLNWWEQQGRGIEVVSDFEFRAALQEGFQPERILVNGPAKHRWLPRFPIPKLRVNFDSPREMHVLLPMAKQLDWSVGVRCHTRQEFDPGNRHLPTQFGMLREEAVAALKKLQRAAVRLETIHFHLRTNVASASIYGRALDEVADICQKAGFKPKHLDCGGGFPPHQIRSRRGKPYDAQFNLGELGAVYRSVLEKRLPGVEELWLENGRFLSAHSGVLVTTVLDAKERSGVRYLICDGGRTTNALISCWEEHDLFPLRRRRGPACDTIVCGPTCMAFDQLARLPLAKGITPGDFLVWTGAGAYHIPWETHFSHGLAGVVWHDGTRVTLVRAPESSSEWWSRWKRRKS